MAARRHKETRKYKHHVAGLGHSATVRVGGFKVTCRVVHRGTHKSWR